MDTHLYLLVDKSHAKFKIGLTIDITNRANALSRDWGDIDLDESYTITDTALTIGRLEKTLHFLFSAWNIASDNEVAGHTEWFKTDCLPTVIAEIQRIGKLRGSTRGLIKGVTLTRAATATYKSSKIAHILFKEYRYRVLRLLLLHPEHSYHVREIARLTEAAAGSVHRELRALADAGLLIAATNGRQVEYRANTDCVVYEELISVFSKI